MPDTGCTKTLISASVARRCNLQTDSSVRPSLTAANGQKMTVIGGSSAAITVNKQHAVINVLITDEIDEDMLLCCSDMAILKMLPRGFPHEVVRTAKSWEQGQDICDKLIAKYPDTLSDDLGSATINSDNPMHIHLREGAVPRRVSVARRVPLRYEDAAQTAVSSHIKKRIIVPVSEPTEWCSPAFFVPKPNGKVRLVTDYTYLNKFVKRPVHPFPPTKEILQAIPADANWFVKMDAVHGYF